MAALAGAEFIPIPISQVISPKISPTAICAGRVVLRECAWRGEVPAEQGRARRRLQGGDHGRRLGRDLGGYAHFRRDMLLYNREGQDPAAT